MREFREREWRREDTPGTNSRRLIRFSAPAATGAALGGTATGKPGARRAGTVHRRCWAGGLHPVLYAELRSSTAELATVRKSPEPTLAASLARTGESRCLDQQWSRTSA